MTEYTTNAGKRLQDTNTHLEQRIAELEYESNRHFLQSEDALKKLNLQQARIAELEAEAREWKQAWEAELSGGRQSRIAELEAAIASAPCPSWWDEKKGCRYWCMNDDCVDTDQPCWKREVN